MPPAWFKLGQDAWIYYFVLAFAVVCFYLISNFVAAAPAGRWLGFAKASCRRHRWVSTSNGTRCLSSESARCLAVSVVRLSTFSIGFIGPDSFTLMLSIGFLAAIVVGGLGTIAGALIAGLFLQFVPSWASDLGQALSGAVYGGILIACMFLMPRGIAGSLIRLFEKRRGCRRAVTEAPRSPLDTANYLENSDVE